MSYLRHLSLAGALLVTPGGGSVAGAEQEAAKEEAGICQAGKAYLEALQAGDAKRLAAAWTAESLGQARKAASSGRTKSSPSLRSLMLPAQAS